MEHLHVVLGTGPLGPATARALVARGQAVRLVNRRGIVAVPPPGAQVVAADLSDAPGMRRIAEGAVAIHFCVQPPYHLWATRFPALQDNAIALAETTGARLVVAENLYGYGPVDLPMTEEAPLAATTRKGKTRAAMHRALRAAHDAGRIDMAVARGSDFFGPGVTGAALGAPVFEAILAGRPVTVMDNPDLPHSYTFVPDFGAVMAILATGARASGELFHVPNAPAMTTRAIIRRAALLSGREVRLRIIAPWQLRLLSVAVRPLREMVEMTCQGTRPFVDHARFVSAFGDISTPPDEALLATLDSLRRDPAPRIPVAA